VLLQIYSVKHHVEVFVTLQRQRINSWYYAPLKNNELAYSFCKISYSAQNTSITI